MVSLRHLFLYLAIGLGVTSRVVSQSVVFKAPDPTAAQDEQTLISAGVKLVPAELMRLVTRHAAGHSDYTKSKGVIERLGSDSFTVREAATKELLALGRPVLAALQRAARHEDPEIRRRASECAERIKGEVALFLPAARVIVRKPHEGALRQILAIRDQETRLKCLQAAVRLAERGEVSLPAEARAELLKGLEHEDHGTRWQAMLGLSMVKGKEPLDELIRLTGHKTAGVRAAAVCLLGQHADRADEVRSVMRKAMSDPDALVRRWATNTLRFFPDAEWATEMLIKALNDEDPGDDQQMVAAVAADNLLVMKFRTREAIPALALAACSANKHLSRTARSSLGTLGSQDDESAKQVLPHLLQFLESKDLTDRSHAAGCLSRMGPRAAPAVLNLLRALDAVEPDPRKAAQNVFTTIIRAFEEIGPGAAPAVRTLVRILRDEKKPEYIRCRAALALGGIGIPAKAALDALRKATESDDFDLRRYAKVALTKLVK